MATKRARTDDFDEDLIKEIEERRKISEHAFQTLVTLHIKRIEEDMTNYNKKGRYWYIAEVNIDTSDVQTRAVNRIIEIYREKAYKVKVMSNNKFKIIWSEKDAEE